jgi:hypothetical protein
MSIRRKLKDILGFDTRAEVKEMTEETKKRITEFLGANKNLIVAVLDPETDVIAVGFKEHLFAHRAVDKSTGKPGGIVADMLRYNKSDAKIKDSINQVLLLIDGSFHAIARRLAGKEEKVEDQPTEPIQ